MKNKLIAFVAMAFLLGNLMAICAPNEKSIYVPAVIGERDGGLVNITVRTVNGTGTSFFATSPNVGVATQQSEQTAVEQAGIYAGMNTSYCDYLLYLENVGASTYIDGPSAGNGMALATIAALENKTVRQDAAFTGTIEDDGSVGPVGGLVEKATAVAQNGLKVFVTPRQEVYERLLLSSIADRYNLSIVEVDNLSESAQIAFSPDGTPVQKTPDLKATPLPQNLADFSKYPADEGLAAFSEIANSIIENARYTLRVSNLTSRGPEFVKLNDYFADQLANQQTLLDKGYLFTSANNVFTSMVDIKMLETGLVEKLDLNYEYGATQSCLASLPPTSVNTGNFEWVGAAQIRQTWAQKMANETLATNVTTHEDEYLSYRNYLYAQDWCYISGKILEQSQRFSGESANQSALGQMAQGYISDATDSVGSLPDADSDLVWHLEAAKQSFGQGRYVAAIFDAVYVKQFSLASSNWDNDSHAAGANAAKLNNENFASSWAKIYQTQGSYLYNSAQGSQRQMLAAYKILLFAKGIDTAYAQEKQILEAGAGAQSDAGAQQQGSGDLSQGTRPDSLSNWQLYLYAAIVGIVLLLFFAAIAFVVLKRNAQGKGKQQPKQTGARRAKKA